LNVVAGNVEAGMIEDVKQLQVVLELESFAEVAVAPVNAGGATAEIDDL